MKEGVYKGPQNAVDLFISLIIPFQTHNNMYREYFHIFLPA